jgi:nucleoside-diphosphate-sugar epimerase
MNKDSRVFIAGGSGLVGRAIVKNLKDRVQQSHISDTQGVGPAGRSGRVRLLCV